MEKLLSIDDLSEILGVKKATIYSWTSQDKIPYIKLNKRLIKFKESEILEWLQKMSIEPKKNHITKRLGKYNQPKITMNKQDDFIARMVSKEKEEVLQ